MKHFCVFIFLILILVIHSGCSGGIINKNPNAPDFNSLNEQNSNKLIGIMVESMDENGTPLSGSGMLGVFSIHIDKQSLTGELTPFRKLSLDDALEVVDIKNFLSLAPCTDCVKLMSIELDPESRILAKIGIKHPFNAGDPLKPITGRNRADLHVFNVEGTVVFDDSAGVVNFSGLSDSVGPPYLTNANGYSSYLDPAIDEIFPTAATLHPYILHFADYSEENFDPLSPTGFISVTDPGPSGNLVMAMGCDYDVRDYILDIPESESVDFIFAVGCTYAVSAASKSQRFNPEFQIPQHNKKAASEVSVEFVNNELTPGNSSSSAEIEVRVLDISHGVPVGSALNEMLERSDVSRLFVEVPGVTDGAIEYPLTPIGGDGRDPLNPLVFRLVFNNALGAGEGVYPSLVKVLDSYPAGINSSPLLNGMDAIKRVSPFENPLTGLYGLDEFATYMTFSTEITASNRPPDASFTSEPPGTPNLSINYLDSVTFTSTSTDPDDPMTPEGQIVSYEWDFNWDGDPLNFNDDTSGMGTEVETHKFMIAGIYFVGLRVTDGGTPPLSDIYSIQITVDEWSQEMIVDPANGRIPKITQMPGGKMMLIWSGQDGRNHYNIYDNSWSPTDTLSTTTTNYLAIYPGPGQEEAWAAGGTRWFRYSGSPGLWSMASGSILSCIQTHIYSSDTGGYGVIDNTNSAFGWIIRIYYSSMTSTSPAWTPEYIVWYPYNNRLMGESRIVDKTSSGQILLAYKQDLAIDPYRAPQDLRYVHVARINPTSSGYSHPAVPIDQGAHDKLDSVVIACDTLDRFHVAYRRQPDGGGNYSLFYKRSSDSGETWSPQSTFYNGANAPEYEYVSIDTDSSNRIAITYRLDNNIYWLSSWDGVTWSSLEIVNESFPGLPTHDKEQYMIIDSSNQTHVVWDRCATGAVGYGPIRHRIRAPIG